MQLVQAMYSICDPAFPGHPPPSRGPLLPARPRRQEPLQGCWTKDARPARRAREARRLQESFATRGNRGVPSNLAAAGAGWRGLGSPLREGLPEPNPTPRAPAIRSASAVGENLEKLTSGPRLSGTVKLFLCPRFPLLSSPALYRPGCASNTPFSVCQSLKVPALRAQSGPRDASSQG